jgi:flagellar hook protein FlgE
MLSSLDSAVSALDQFQGSIDIIGNNIANENTVGYKDARANFQDALSETLQGGAGTPIQIGTGVSMSGTSTNFVEGGLSQSNSPTDLAINGNGFFVVRDPNTSATYLTRAGDFTVDKSGFLVTQQGMRVEGYSDAGLTTIGDIQIDNTGAPNGSTAGVASYNFSSNGTLTVNLSDNTSFTRGQVLLQTVASPETLLKQGQNLYGNIAAAGPLAQPTAPGTSGTGIIDPGYLESSNVNLADEMANLIIAERGFQAGSRVVTTSDEILQEVVNLKR